MTRLSALIAIATLLTNAAAAPDAVACGNVVYLSKSVAVKRLAKAERLLAAGASRQALAVLKEISTRDRDLVARASFIWAVGTMRGDLGQDVSVPVFQWEPFQILKDHAAAHPDDAVATARYAEALSLTRGADAEVAAFRASGLTMLRDLQQRDLMPDAEAWATLAKLAQLAGDAAEADAAVARCETLLRNKKARRAAVCKK